MPPLPNQMMKKIQPSTSKGRGSSQPIGFAFRSRDNQNFSWLNLFYFLNLDDGKKVGRALVITDDSDDRWNPPVGLGVCKFNFFGKMLSKMGVEFQWMPLSPDTYGQQWSIRLVLAPIILSIFQNCWILFRFGEGRNPKMRSFQRKTFRV